MPRYANVGPNVDIWYSNNNGEGSSTFDLCVKCGEKYEDIAIPNGVLETYHKGEPLGMLEEFYSPLFEEDVDIQFGYTCDICKCKLTPKNYLKEPVYHW